MPIRTARFAFVLLLGVTLGCARTPASPDPVDSPVAPPAAPPQAVLDISPGPTEAPLGTRGYTPFVFDGSASTGEGLIYRLEFGDGASTNRPVATHVFDVELTNVRLPGNGRLTARLTVTDRLGRSAIAERQFFVAEIENNKNLGSWTSLHRNGAFTVVRLHFRNGVNLSGWLDLPEYGLDDMRITATLTGERDVVIRTVDGAIEMFGRLEWRDDVPLNLAQSRVRLRLTFRGGPADGATTVMQWDDGVG